MTPDQLAAYGDLAVLLIDLACNGALGRSEADPVYKEWTGGRDTGKSYSSCADLAHRLWHELGLQFPWMNSGLDGRKFVCGVNLNRWCAPPIGKCGVATAKLGVPAAGDVIVIDTKLGGHVMCCQLFDATHARLYTGEYGQPGGALRHHEVRDGKVDGHKVLGHASLQAALQLGVARPPNLGMLAGWQAPEAIEALRQRIAP